MADRTVKLAFDPRESDLTRGIFRDEIGRVLWLLWRPNHIVSDKFQNACQDIADRIRKKRPETPGELARCLCPTWGYYIDFTEHDVSKFAEWALPFFQGLLSVDYKICLP